MWLMPYKIFKQQGRIMKSLKAWREEAKAKGWLVQFDPEKHKVVFISHTASRAQEPGSRAAHRAPFLCPNPCLVAGRLTLPCCVLASVVGPRVYGRIERPWQSIR